MTIERIDYWDKCLGSGDFGSAVEASPDEAKLLFGDKALHDLNPTNLALIIFAHRTLLMTDNQINELRARIRNEINSSKHEPQSAGQSYSVSPGNRCDIPITPIGLHVSEALAVAPTASRAEQMRKTALRILLKSGITPLKKGAG